MIHRQRNWGCLLFTSFEFHKMNPSEEKCRKYKRRVPNMQGSECRALTHFISRELADYNDSLLELLPHVLCPLHPSIFT